MFKTNELKTLAVDLYHNKALTYNDKPADDAFRNMLYDALHLERGSEKIPYANWREHKNKVFQILEVAVDAVMPTLIKDQYDRFADTRVVAAGDKPVFKIKDNSLFHVSMIASGNQSIQRQELHNSQFTVDTDWYGTAAYAEFEQLLVGQIDWKHYVDTSARSFTTFIGQRVFEAFTNSYDSLRAVRKVTGTYDEDKLLELVQHIQASSGGKQVEVYGTAKALRKITKDLDKSSDMKDEFNRVGYVNTIAGVDLIALPQAYKTGKEEFAVDDNTLVILPKGEKIVSIVLEGDAIVKEDDGENRTDMQREFKTMKKFGIRVAALSIFGMYKYA